MKTKTTKIPTPTKNLSKPEIVKYARQTKDVELVGREIGQSFPHYDSKNREETCRNFAKGQLDKDTAFRFLKSLKLN